MGEKIPISDCYIHFISLSRILQVFKPGDERQPGAQAEENQTALPWKYALALARRSLFGFFTHKREDLFPIIRYIVRVSFEKCVFCIKSP